MHVNYALVFDQKCIGLVLFIAYLIDLVLIYISKAEIYLIMTVSSSIFVYLKSRFLFRVSWFAISIFFSKN